MKYVPSYINLYKEGILEERANAIYEIIQECKLCPHNCGVNRIKSEKGKCNSASLPIVSSYNLHFGEESCLVGNSGSGTIFFTNCNLSCVFCQNYDISHLGYGNEISYEELAKTILSLQARGAHNINFVSPTHMIYSILMSLLIAIPEGLNIPLVYNSGGYDSFEVLRILDGIFDIYMPDLKYMNSEISELLSGVGDYPDSAAIAIKEMHRQVGDLIVHKGIASRGLLVRHLVLPNNIASTDRVISFIADLSKDTYINIMDQYRPAYRARECFDLRRRVTLQEYDEAVSLARKAGLRRIDA